MITSSNATTPGAQLQTPGANGHNGHNGHNAHQHLVLETAQKLAGWGMDWLVYERRSKDPHTPHWQKQPSPPLADATDDKNIGVHVRNALVDGDLDTMEAVIAARYYFPPTGLMWGRQGKPRSHLWYQLPAGTRIPKGKKSYEDPTPLAGMKKKLLELRDNGQTVAPSSAHQDTGGLVHFEPDGDGAASGMAMEPLVHAAEYTAAAALVARYWMDGSRHDMAKSLAGLLWHGGMPVADAEQLMTAVCAAAGDDDLDNRLGCVRDTYRSAAAGQPVTGGPTLTLEDHLPEAQVRKLRQWLGLRVQARVGILGPDLMPLSGDGDGERALPPCGRARCCTARWKISGTSGMSGAGRLIAWARYASGRSQ